MPAQAGIHDQALRSIVGPRLRGDDEPVAPYASGVTPSATRKRATML